jgi:hypothetical protein
MKKADHKTLAVWAIDCAERVMPFFEEKYPKNYRPRNAIRTLQKWIDTGIFKMAIIRKVSLDSHAAARKIALPALRPAPRARPWQRRMFLGILMDLQFMLNKLFIEPINHLMRILP